MSTPYSASLGLREARLRPEAAARSPRAPAEVWLPACTLASKALQQTDGDDRATHARRRALADDAFEFRGGRPELALRSTARTRRGDHPRR